MITAQELASALRAVANALDGQGGTTQAVVQQTAPSNTLQPVVPTNPQPTVTSDQITALIMPHISNQAVKDALGVAMRELGVNNLPEAQPHQYGALFQSFTAVLARFGIGGAAQPTNNASII